MDNKIIIDLETYKTKGSKVFTGRDRGISIREKSGIDDIISNGKNVLIYIPKEIMSVNPSFLEELLYNVVKSFGKNDFDKRVAFENLNPRYDFQSDLEEAIDRILRKNNALAK